MWAFFRVSLLVLGIGIGAAAKADREIHVVSVGKGQRTADYYALPEAHVLVDRPGHDVVLVLLDGGVLRWHVETTEGTTIAEVIRSGPGTSDSEILLHGIPVMGIQVPGLPLVFRPRGRDFSVLIEAVTNQMGAKRIHNFQGAHKFTGRTLNVDRVQAPEAGLSPDYLSEQLSASDDLPGEIRAWLRKGGSTADYIVGFDGAGLRLTGPNGTQRFPASSEVPEILLPVAGVYAPDTQTIYGITYGAEGYVYAVDVQDSAWSVVTSLHGYDAAALLYDPDDRLLILTGAFSRPGEIRAVGLDGNGFSIFVPTTAFPGLTDLFDFGNEDGPPLLPRVFSEGWLLLEAREESANPDPAKARTRIYALRIDTGEVRLLRYRNE
ncbi:MAG: hypothetical protein AAF919_08815 [Pseudomonadota bacterium]